jgi:hypothetical protein
MARFEHGLRAAHRFASEPATPITFIPAINAKFTAALPTPPAAV